MRTMTQRARWPTSRRLRSAKSSWIKPAGVIGALAAVALIGLMLARASAPPSGMPTSPAIEARWGVRVTQIGVTADGGLVDFRFVVLDADKALDMMLNVNNLPVLVDEDSGTTITSTVPMGDDHYLNVGQTYFLLYRNALGAIKPGSQVTVKFGNLTLKHVIAK